jgi:hypothetical protein
MRRPWIFPPKPPLPALCAAGNPSRRRRRFPASAAASSPRSRPRPAPGGELHAYAICCRARAPWRPSDLAGVPEPCRRVVRPRRRVSAAVAAPGRFVASRTACRCLPRHKPDIKTLVYGLADELRRRSSPAAAVASPPPPASAHLRFEPSDRDPTSLS